MVADYLNEKYTGRSLDNESTVFDKIQTLIQAIYAGTNYE
jgi:hypothetical protein